MKKYMRDGLKIVLEKDNEVRKLEIIQDDYAESPREWENLGKMICWHSRYNIGDEHSYSSPENLLQELVREYVSEKKIIQYIKDGNAKDMRIIYNRSENHYELQEFWGYTTKKWETFSDQCFTKDEFDLMADKIVENLGRIELEDLISESKEIVILPVYLYDHSIQRVSTGSFIGRALHAEWDSGQVGYIYATRDTFIKETGYSERELFNTDQNRKPIIGEHVKVKGFEDKSYDGFGKVIEVNHGKYTVDYDYNKGVDYRKPENKITVSRKDIIEVMSNKAEKMLEGEVETFDQYLIGDVYGYRESKFVSHGADVESIDDVIDNDFFWEETDSCWGFYHNDLDEFLGDINTEWLEGREVA